MAASKGTVKMMQVAYNILFMGTAVLWLPFFMLTLLHPKRRATIRHRLGWMAGTTPKAVDSLPKRPIWIHALSVGEVLSAEPLVKSVLQHLSTHPVVFSVSTRTGMEMARRLFEGHVQQIIYYPYDFIFSVRRIVESVDPHLVVIVETDIWPNFLFHLKQRGVPVLWVNARISRATLKGYRALGRFARTLLDTFFRIGAQSNLDVDRLTVLKLPQDKVMLTGNMKFDQETCPEPGEVDRQLRTQLGIHPDQMVLVAGSTHAGEETVLISSFAELKTQFSKLIMVLAPRDPLRAESIAKLCRGKDLTVGFLSSLSTSADANDIWIVNTIGLLRRLYAIADIAVVGGSFVAQGGHNPLEPAVYGKPLLFGPDMSDFNTVAQLLVTSKAALQIESSDLYAAMAGLLQDAQRRQHMGAQALKVFNVNQGAVDKSVAIINHALNIG